MLEDCERLKIDKRSNPMSELNNKIESCVKEQELDNKSTVEYQAIKTAGEIARLIEGISEDNIDLIRCSIGGVYVNLVIGNMLDRKLNLEEIHSFLLSIGDFVFKKDKRRSIGAFSNMIDSFLLCGYTKANLYAVMAELIVHSRIYHLDFQNCVKVACQELFSRNEKVIDNISIKEESLPC